MTKPHLLAFLAICVGCSSPKPSDPLHGTYVSWMFMDGQAVPADGSGAITQKLILKPGGKYTSRMETTVIWIVSEKADGNYTLSGDHLNLSGTMTRTVEEGDKVATNTEPHEMSFTLENGMLREQDVPRFPSYFRKEGTGPPPLPPELQLKQTDPAATALIKKLRSVYSSLKTFSATGTVKSQGGGFVAKDARFKVFFVAPSKFRFEASILEGGMGDDRAEITWDGGPKCWWYSKEYGAITDRDLGNAVSIVSVNFGPELEIFPVLFLPKEMGVSSLLESPEATLLPDETVDGRACSVLQLRSKDSIATKLWVEKSSTMILRLYEDLRDVAVTFDPHPNVPIGDQELMLGKRSQPGKNR